MYTCDLKFKGQGKGKNRFSFIRGQQWTDSRQTKSPKPKLLTAILSSGRMYFTYQRKWFVFVTMRIVL